MRLPVAFILAAMTMYGPAVARSDAPSYEEWTNAMLAKLPFEAGVLTRQRYRASGQVYLRGLIDFYEAVGARKIDNARARGRFLAAREIRRRIDSQIAAATRYVGDTERGLFLSLDPAGSNSIPISDAREQLMQMAGRADFNRNGVLEPIEADVGEAALASGVDLGDKMTRDAFLHDLDRSAFGPPD